MTTGPVLVMIIEDQPGFRQLVATVLDQAPFDVRAPDLDTWVEETQQTCPDVVLLDLGLHAEVDAVQMVPKIIASCPTTMVAALTAHSAEEMEQPTLAAGAFVFYEKDMLRDLPTYILEDLALFRRGLTGEHVIAPAAHQRRPPYSSTPPSTHPAP